MPTKAMGQSVAAGGRSADGRKLEAAAGRPLALPHVSDLARNVGMLLKIHRRFKLRLIT
jgi:hypothetical protein